MTEDCILDHPIPDFEAAEEAERATDERGACGSDMGAALDMTFGCCCALPCCRTTWMAEAAVVSERAAAAGVDDDFSLDANIFIR
jgi:hypothetical protein